MAVRVAVWRECRAHSIVHLASHRDGSGVKKVSSLAFTFCLSLVRRRERGTARVSVRVVVVGECLSLRSGLASRSFLCALCCLSCSCSWFRLRLSRCRRIARVSGCEERTRVPSRSP